MKKYFLFLSLSLFLAACSTVALTGRKQLNLVSEQEVLTSSFQQYNDYIESAPLSTNATETARVERVGRNIARAVEQYFKNNGISNQLNGYQWEFHLIKSNEVNAFCMPGGKIVVYEGILPYTKDDTGLAVVLGHEVAHAVARHSNERMSQQIATQVGGGLVNVALSGRSPLARELGAQVYGLGAQYGVMLPYSRNHELEADHLGLIFMAMAGYNPDDAVAFWQRMASASSGGKTPEFMSTHPSDDTRINKIKSWLPEAEKYYQAAK
ncbi:MAG: M48 family metallopeptidase [Odoribacter sp.]|nr:M48 family metallopeptidase [Odoribacter sp.]